MVYKYSDLMRLTPTFSVSRLGSLSATLVRDAYPPVTRAHFAIAQRTLVTGGYSSVTRRVMTVNFGTVALDFFLGIGKIMFSVT